MLAAGHCMFLNLCWLKYEPLCLPFSLLLVLISLYLYKVFPLLVKTTSNRWHVILHRKLPATDDVWCYSAESTHSFLTTGNMYLAPLCHVQKVFSHQDQLKTASRGHSCSLPLPVPPSSLYPCYISCTVWYQMLTSTSVQRWAELNWCQTQGLQQHLSIWNLLSWKQQVSGSVFWCNPIHEVRAGQHGRSPWQGMERLWGWGEVLAGCQAAPGWGTGSTGALVSARGLLTHRNHLAPCPVGVPEPGTP